MRKRTLAVTSAAVCGLVAALAWTPVVRANVYAAHLSGPASWDIGGSGNLTLEYRLNEAAASVTVEIYRASAPGTVVKTLTGGTAKGLNSVQWDGSKDGGGNADSASDYKFRVLASHAGYGDWTKISDEENINSMKFYSPRGIDVDTNQNSPTFGRVYVSESSGGTTGGRTTQHGLYALNNDGTDGIGQGDTARFNSTFIGGFVSPRRCVRDASGDIYIVDWSDGHSGVWKCDRDLSPGSIQEVLDSTGRDTVGLNAVHGSVSTAWTEGSGASFSLVTADEDLEAGDPGGIMPRYNIGNSALPYSGSWSKEADLRAPVVNSQIDFVRKANGDYVWTQHRGLADVPSLMIFTANLGDPANPTVHYSRTEALYYHGVAIDEGLGWIALACYYGDFEIRSMSDPNTKITTTQLGPNGYSTDVAIDAAKNIWVVNLTTERCTVWSPAGANNYTTSYYSTMNVTIPSGATPPSIADAKSVKPHGGSDYNVDLWEAGNDTGNTEDRQGGPTSVVVQFDKNVQRVTNTLADVLMVNGTVDAIGVAGDTVTVTVSGVVNGVVSTMTFPGIATAGSPAQINTDTLCIRPLIGDADNSGAVNIFDLIQIRNNLNLAVTAGNFRNDVTADNAINIFDLIATRNVLNTTVVGCP